MKSIRLDALDPDWIKVKPSPEPEPAPEPEPEPEPQPRPRRGLALDTEAPPSLFQKLRRGLGLGGKIAKHGEGDQTPHGNWARGKLKPPKPGERGRYFHGTYVPDIKELKPMGEWGSSGGLVFLEEDPDKAVGWAVSTDMWRNDRKGLMDRPVILEVEVPDTSKLKRDAWAESPTAWEYPGSLKVIRVWDPLEIPHVAEEWKDTHVTEVAKHGEGDQTPHGNWARYRGLLEHNTERSLDAVWTEMGAPMQVRDSNFRIGRDESNQPIIQHGFTNKWGRFEVTSTEPVKHLFRVVSEEDYQRMLAQGYLDTHGERNFGDEGMNASTDSTGGFYFPRQGAARIIRIDYRPEDGWRVDPADEYVKTHTPVPWDRVSKVSPIIDSRIEERRHSMAETHPDLFGNKWRRGTYYYLLGDDEQPLDQEFLLTPGDVRRALGDDWKSVTKVVKHMGPGDHPSGTPQSVHGRRGLGVGSPPTSANRSESEISTLSTQGYDTGMLRAQEGTPPPKPSPARDRSFFGRTSRFEDWYTPLPVPDDPHEALAQVKEMGDYYRELVALLRSEDARQVYLAQDPSRPDTMDAWEDQSRYLGREMSQVVEQAKLAAKKALPAVIERGGEVAAEIDARLEAAGSTGALVPAPRAIEEPEWVEQFLVDADEIKLQTRIGTFGATEPEGPTVKLTDEIRSLAKDYVKTRERLLSVHELRREAHSMWLDLSRDGGAQYTWMNGELQNLSDLSMGGHIDLSKDQGNRGVERHIPLYSIPRDLVIYGDDGRLKVKTGKSVAALSRIPPQLLIQRSTEWKDSYGTYLPVFPELYFDSDYQAMNAEAGSRGEILVTEGHYKHILNSEVDQLDTVADRIATSKKLLVTQLRRAASEVSGSGADQIALSVLSSHREFGGTLDSIQTNRSRGKKALDAESSFFPSDWIDQSNSHGPIHIQVAKSRAHYVHRHFDNKHGFIGKIKVSADYLDDDVLHEMGHRFEATVPEIIALESAFYDHRTNARQEGLVPLRQIYPRHNYKPGELTRPDKFADAYMGKPYDGPGYGGGFSAHYRPGAGFGKWEQGFELLSMGLPRVYGRSGKDTEPGKGENALDDEMRHFILGLMVEA